MLKIDKKLCTGCALCKQICPKKCIEMKKNDEGFLYPEIIDKSECINCNLCNKFCPYKMKVDNNEKQYYALQLKNYSLLKKCASGGAFSALATLVIELNGRVCGVGQIGKNAEFIIVDSKSDIELLTGSKYFQCSLSDKVYKEIDRLNKDKFFLFCGTPCQVAAIEIKFRKKFKDKLITVELICQGVPSEMVVNRYYSELEFNMNSSIKDHKFRSKDKFVGRNYLNKYTYENGNIVYLKGSKDVLTKSFQNKIFLRESCYSCHFANNNRVADFTIGDLWNYDLQNKKIKFNFGVSVVVLNTMNARKIFELINKIAYIEKIDQTSLKDNVPFNAPVKKPLSRNFSYKLLNSNMKFKYVVNLCCIKYNCKHLVKKILRKEI